MPMQEALPKTEKWELKKNNCWTLTWSFQVKNIKRCDLKTNLTPNADVICLVQMLNEGRSLFKTN